ncbi:hypothetical protein [Deminuibacter soli]|uniref:DUF5723 domain-containing protein n=1 Tax=Deminuibacter soli TaxID=2291815 RepID=A0A3E1NHQ7_9BACT|nr:hypothetical protein [Deminuibacter soli]RFM27318.1 hypothetical protein DXN05_14920 [Deminuibacter soli]
MQQAVITILAVYAHLLCTRVFAQDNQYETIQLGAKNSILSGASVSRQIDGTAVFSNPATLAQSSGSSITLNSAAWSLTNISFTGKRQQLDITNNYLHNIPAMLAGDIQLRNKKAKLGYAIYHHVLDNLRFSERASGSNDIINNTESPGAEQYTADLHLNTDITEIAGVVGGGYRLTDHFYIGASAEFLFRTQTYQEGFHSFVTPNAPLNTRYNLVSAEQDIDMYFNNVMSRLKLGIAYKAKQWSAGVTVTTPTIRLYSYGEFRGDMNLGNLQVEDVATAGRKTYVVNTFMIGAHVQYKYPWSVSGGVSGKFGRLQTAVAANYYSSLKQYTVLDANSAAAFLPVDGAVPLQPAALFRAWSVNKPVLNLSCSFDYLLRPAFHVLFSARSDNHYGDDRPQGTGFQLAQKLWNIYHVTTGAMFKFNNSEVIAGIQYSTGTNTQYQLPYSTENIKEQSYLQGIPAYGKMHMSTISLLLSFSLVFLTKRQ